MKENPESNPRPRPSLSLQARLVLTSAVLMTIICLLAGCASRQKPADGGELDTALTEEHLQRHPGTPAPQPGDRVVTFDVNRDGNPNIFHHYRTLPDGEEVIIRKDIDLNGNGRIDVWRFYEDGEVLVKEAFDLDFDGVIDVWNFFDERGRLARKEADLSLDGQTDLWKYYENGKLVRKERDRTGNGQPDYFEFWEDGQIDRIGEDLNGDGTVDRWTRRAR